MQRMESQSVVQAPIDADKEIFDLSLTSCSFKDPDSESQDVTLNQPVISN